MRNDNDATQRDAIMAQAVDYPWCVWTDMSDRWMNLSSECKMLTLGDPRMLDVPRAK